MKDLNVLFETKEYIIVSCENVNGQNRYVEGFTDTFTYERLSIIVDDITIIPKTNSFIGYKVIYEVVSGDKHYLVDETDTKYVTNDFEDIKVKVLSVPDGRFSISFLSDRHFDAYKLFTENGVCVCETEDCLMLGDFGGFNGYVCGYVKQDDKYIVKGISDEFKAIPETISAHDIELSIVIPVYNSFLFLPRTLQSILASTYDKWEIILVDDGSDDKTASLCDSYESFYPNIRVIHQDNAGVCKARNTGMDAAVGAWLAFVDNDDIIHPFMYEKLFKEAKAGDYDIAIAQCLMREDYYSHKMVLSDKIDEPVIHMNSFKEVMDGKGKFKNIYFVAIWNKIVKTDIARKVRFMNDMPYYEDTAYTAPLYSYINKFVLVKDAYYVWDKRKQLTVGTASTTHYHRPSEVIWKYYILSYAAPLFIGNQDEDVAFIYKQDIMKHLLEKYKERNYASTIKHVFEGLLKYLQVTYDLPMEVLLASTDANMRKLYSVWCSIEHTSTKPWNGQGEVPKEYYA